MKFLTGKKTYIAATVLALVAIAGFWYDLIPQAEAALLLGAALGLIGLGHKADRVLALLAALKAQQEAGGPPILLGGQEVGKDKVDELLAQLAGEQRQHSRSGPVEQAADVAHDVSRKFEEPK